jgi:seryl-tRNA synthetase
LDYQKRANKDLQTDFIRLKEILKQRDLLIEDSGLVLYTDNETKQKAALLASKTSKGNVDTSNEIKSILPAALVAPETAKLLDTLGEGTIDDKLRKLLNEKQDLKEQNNRLTTELDDERTKSAHLEKKLIANANKLQDNQENSQELHEIQSNFCFFLFLLNLIFVVL